MLIRQAPTRFIGRTADLRALSAALEARVRLVTLLGPPGIGKTRLAIELARMVEGEKTRHVELCDLTEAQDLGGITTKLGATLGLMPRIGASLDDSVTELGVALARLGPALLILDNFEQIVECAPSTVGAWLRLAPDLSILATSRERLHLFGEVIHDLEPLALPDEGSETSSEALELLLDRGRCVRRDFKLTDDNRSTLVALVRELEGIPLAIELAASRLRVLHPAELLEQLRRRRLDVLSPPSSAASARNATLRGAIAWSVRLLEPWERDALAQCSLFCGGFTLEAAEAILDLSAHPEAPSPLDVLQALCDKSLVRASEPSHAKDTLRYDLYLSVREFAGEHLRGEMREASIRRHAAHYLTHQASQAHQANVRWRPDAQRPLAPESENLLAIVRRSLAPGSPLSVADGLKALVVLDSLVHVRGPHLDLLTAALDRSAGREDVEPGIRARALHARGRLLQRSAHYDRALADLDEARCLAETLADEQLLGAILSCRACIEEEQGRLGAARETATRALALTRRSGDRVNEGHALGCLAILSARCGEPEAAITLFEQAILIQREVGNTRVEAINIGNLGELKRLVGRLDEARADFERALSVFREVADVRNEGYFLGNLATLEQELGNLEAARAYGDRAIALIQASGARRMLGFALGQMGGVAAEQGNDDEARALYARAVEIMREVGDSVHAGLLTGRLAAAHAAAGRVADAAAGFETAGELLAGTSDSHAMAVIELHRLHLTLAEAAARASLGDVDGAAERRSSVQARVAAARGPLLDGSDEARFAVRLLERALAEQEPIAPPGRPVAASRNHPPGTLVLGADLAWLRLPSGKHVDLARQKKIRLVLEALVTQRLATPGQGLKVEALQSAAWPGERMLPKAGATRVYVALSTLRRLGLSELICSRSGSYFLDPAVPVVRER